MFCYSINDFGKHGQVFEIVTCKIFVRLNFARKHKIILFLAVVDWDTVTRML